MCNDENFQNYTDIFIYRYVVAFGMQNIKQNCMTGEARKLLRDSAIISFAFFVLSTKLF